MTMNKVSMDFSHLVGTNMQCIYNIYKKEEKKERKSTLGDFFAAHVSELFEQKYFTCTVEPESLEPQSYN